MLSLLLSSALTQGAVIPAQPALVEVKRGRARVVREDGAEPLSAVDPATTALGPAYLEVSAGSVVTVSWRGIATLRFEGPAAFEWDGSEAGGELGWRLVDAAALEAEVRRGLARLELPLGWEADLRAGAYHLASTAGGGTRVVHQAGRDLRLRCLGGEGGTRPPVFLRAGETARLATPPTLKSRPDTTALAPAWSRVDWPWGSHGVPGRPDLGAGPAWRTVEWPFGPAATTTADPAADAWGTPGGAWERFDAPTAPLEARDDAAAPREPAPVEPEPAERFESVEPVEPVELAAPPEADASVHRPETAPEADSESPAVATTEVAADPSIEPQVVEREREPVADPPEVSAPEPEPRPAVDPEPRPETAPLPAAEAEPTGEPDPVIEAEPAVAPEPVAEPEPVVEPEPVTPPEPARDADAEADRAPAPTPEPAAPEVVTSGPLRHRPHPAFTVTPAGEGLWRARVAADASEPAVVLGSRFDLWVGPGGSLLVDENGALRSHEGAVELKPAARR